MNKDRLRIDTVNRDALIKFYNALSNERKDKFMSLVETLSGLLTKIKILKFQNHRQKLVNRVISTKKALV